MVSAQFLPFVFAAVCALGFYGAYLYGRKTKKFRWTEYVALIIVPVLCSVGLVGIYGIDIFYLFVASALLGAMFEYGVGLAYHKTLNKRLWTYSRYAIGGYTSWLGLPMWGVAGVIFWWLGKNIGL